jgi:hypothetical protein
VRFETRPIGDYFGVYDTVEREWMRGHFGNVLELSWYAAINWVSIKNKEAANA